MKTAKTLLIASICNALFFVWIYMTHVYDITWTIAGVFHEVLMIPMLLLAPTLFITSLIFVFKKENVKIFALSLLISGTSTASILWLFYRDFQNIQ